MRISEITPFKLTDEKQNRQKEQTQTAASTQVLKQNKLVLKSDEARLDAGRITRIDVERSRRAVFSAELAQISTQESVANQWINLYKTLGGGWNISY